MNLPILPKFTALRIPNAILWGIAICQALRAPVTDANVGYLCGWFLREGGGGQNNPMNTTLRTADSVGEINSVGVQNYGTPTGGVLATVETLASYPAVVESLRSGVGIKGVSVAEELSRWSGGGYSTITPLIVEVNVLSGIAHFKGSVNFNTGEWNIQGVPTEDGNKPHWGTEEKEWSAEIQVLVGPGGGHWRIKGEPANSKPLG